MLEKSISWCQIQAAHPLAETVDPDPVVGDTPADLVDLILLVNEPIGFLVKRLAEVAKLHPSVDKPVVVVVKP